MNNKRIFIRVVLGLLIVTLLGGWYYFSVVRKAPGMEEESQFLTVPFGTVPQTIISFQRIPAGGWSYAGIIQKIDFQNKFFELKLIPSYPVSLKSFGFDDAIRIYFDDDLIFPHMVAETEGGVIVKINRQEDFGLEQVGPGKIVRVFGEVRSDGTFFAKVLFIFDYKSR